MFKFSGENYGSVCRLYSLKGEFDQTGFIFNRILRKYQNGGIRAKSFLITTNFPGIFDDAINMKRPCVDIKQWIKTTCDPKDGKGNLVWRQQPTVNVAVRELGVNHSFIDEEEFSDHDSKQLIYNHNDGVCLYIIAYPENVSRLTDLVAKPVIGICADKASNAWEIEGEVIPTDLGAPIVDQQGFIVGMMGEDNNIIGVKSILEATTENKNKRTFIISRFPLELKVKSFAEADKKTREMENLSAEIPIRIFCLETGITKYFPRGTTHLDYIYHRLQI